MSTDERPGRAGLPSMTRLLEADETRELLARHGRASVLAALRTALDEARDALTSGRPVPDRAALVAAATSALAREHARGVRRVINATGIVLHTNLGRAPLSTEAREAVLAASGPSSVEYDLESGQRGSRTAYSGELAARLCGTEAATVVNNGAAALVLVVAALAGGREVIVSRGELIEIGGSFRLPDIIKVSGARLVEVGTTNRTRLDDYREAIGPDTGMILSVHRSNFRQVGFVADVPTADLAALAETSGLPLVHDLGSGLVATDADVIEALDDEPVVTDSVDRGAHIVLFSGDKLLGGSQAGIIAGRTDLVERCRRHPLARITRIDKLQLAALEATLRTHARGSAAIDLPALAMLHRDVAELTTRAEALAHAVAAHIANDPRRAGTITLAVRTTSTYVGGGSAPGRTLPGVAIACGGVDAQRLAAALRSEEVPVIARIEDDEVLIDLRSVPDGDDAALVDTLFAALDGLHLADGSSAARSTVRSG